MSRTATTFGSRSPLERLLRGYTAESDTERVDLDRTRALLATGGTADPWSRSSPLHVTASALIVDRATQQVLLRWHTRQQAWLHVGGHADPDETDALAVAVREAREETGLDDLAPVRPAPIHIVIVPVPASSTESTHEHADIRFVLTTARPDLARPEKPDAPLRWLSVSDAYAFTTEENLRKTLTRLARLD